MIPSLLRRVLCTVLIVQLSVQLVFAQIAPTITVDTAAPVQNQAEIGAAPNGVPVLDIAAPNASGLSHNKFTDYNVDPRGLILNNSQNVGNTQLGGVVLGNPKLTGSGPAGKILNEVTSTNPSVLEGYTEVKGQAADVIVANPNGITCKGCGFINTPKATLTTGRPVTDGSGGLQGFDVDDGKITIDSPTQLGLDANASAAEIYARAVEINKDIQAQHLSIIAGRNTIDVAGNPTPKASNATAAPEWAIDGKLLGAMQAGRIKVIANEHGVGVRMPANVVALEDLEITANGRLQVKNASAGRDVKLNAATTEHKGTTYATRDVISAAAVKKTIDAGKVVGAGRNVTVSAPVLEVQDNAVLGAGMAAGGIFTAGSGQTTLNANSITASAGSVVHSGAGLQVTAQTLNNQGRIYTDGTAALNITNTTNSSGALLLAGQDLVLNGQNLTNAGAFGALRDSTVTLNTLTNNGTFYVGRDMAMGLTSGLNNTGNILAERNLTITGTAAINNVSATIEAITGNLSITANSLTNRKAAFAVGTVPVSQTTIGSNPRITTTVTRDEVTTDSLPASVLAGRNMVLNLNTLTNDYSLIAANGNLTINAGTVTNTGQNLIETTTTETATDHEQRVCTRRVFGICVNRETIRWTTTDTAIATTTVGNVFATLQAGGSIQITANVIDNGRQTTGQIGLSSGGAALTAPSQTASIAAIAEALSTQSSLFVVNTAAAGRYLIETRPEFTSLGSFYGSDYFLTKLGFDPDTFSKRLGDSFVERRLIENQLFSLTGSRSLSNYADYQAQIQALYDNALTLAWNALTKPTEAQIEALDKDVAWLEPTTVQGQTVYAPKVYLKKRDRQQSPQIKGNSGDLVANALTNHGSLVFSSTGQLDVGTLNNIGGSIAAPTLTILADSLNNLSGRIDGSQLSILANTITNDTAVIRDTTRNGYADRLQQTALLSGSNSLTITTAGDFSSIGGSINAGTLTANIGGNLALGAARLETNREDFFKYGHDKEYRLSHSLGQITTGNANINVDGATSIAGLTVANSGAFSLNAANGIQVETVTDRIERDFKLKIKTGGFMGYLIPALGGVKTEIKKQETINTNLPSTLTAANNLVLDAGAGDLYLRAAKLSSSNGQIVLDGASVNLLAATDSHYYSESKSVEDLFWLTTKDQGFYRETIKPTEINGSVVFNAPVTAEYQTGSVTPSYLPVTATVRYLDPVTKEWKESYSGLSQTGGIIVALALAVATYGIGSELAIGAGAGTATTSGAAVHATITAGGTAFATGGSTFVTLSATSTAIANAAFTSLATTAATSAINRDFNGQSALRGLGTSVLTAGLTSGILGSEYIAKGMGGSAEWQRRLLNHGVGAVVSEGVNSAVYGQQFNLGNALRSGAIAFTASEGASQIGAQVHDENSTYHDLFQNRAVHLGAHALLGAGIAALDDGDPFAGAIGAVTGELTAEAFGNPHNKAQTVALASLAGGLSAAAIGRSGDVTIAANAGGNAAEHNYLDAIWDAGSIAYDGAKITYGEWIGDPELVQEGQIDLATDTAALLIPFAPAGASKVARWLGTSGAKTVSKEGSEVVIKEGVAKNVDQVTTFNKIEKVGSSGGKTAGKSFSQKQKLEAVSESKLANSGKTKCNNCGVETSKAQQSKKEPCRQRMKHRWTMLFPKVKVEIQRQKTDKFCVEIATLKKGIIKHEQNKNIFSLRG